MFYFPTSIISLLRTTVMMIRSSDVRNKTRIVQYILLLGSSKIYFLVYCGGIFILLANIWVLMWNSATSHRELCMNPIWDGAKAKSKISHHGGRTCFPQIFPRGSAVKQTVSRQESSAAPRLLDPVIICGCFYRVLPWRQRNKRSKMFNQLMSYRRRKSYSVSFILISKETDF